MAFVLGLLVVDQDTRHLGKIAWELDPAAGLEKAKAQNRAALLYFTAEW